MLLTEPLAAAAEVGNLLVGRGPTHCLIAMRKPAESSDNFAVLLGVVEIAGNLLVEYR